MTSASMAHRVITGPSDPGVIGQLFRSGYGLPSAIDTPGSGILTTLLDRTDPGLLTIVRIDKAGSGLPCGFYDHSCHGTHPHPQRFQ